MKRFTFPLMISLFFSLHGSSQDSTSAKVYIIRTTSLNGFADPFDIYIDQKMVCKLNNARYSIYTLKEGEHAFDVKQADSHAPSLDSLTKLTVSNGNTYYLELNFGNSGLSKVQYGLITKESADKLLRNCLKKPQCKN